MNEIIKVTGITNREFIEAYARPGCVGLSGGETFIDRAIRRAERHVDANKEWSKWSHALFFQGRRHDGHHWVIESDLQVIRKHISLGVQENRATKYHDERLYSTMAVLDFGLSEEQTALLLREALELVASRTRYSVRELFGTVLALRHPELRGRDNLLAREQSMYCSAFVHHLYRKAGLDLAPGVDCKNTTPEDIARSPLVKKVYVLEREAEVSKISALAGKLKARVKTRLEKVKKRRQSPTP
jgi:hypothetical protein